jgi:uncharacterized membrane protein YgcG
MYSAKVWIPAALVSLAVSFVACTSANDDENRGQTAARATGAGADDDDKGNGNGPPGNNGTVKIQEAGDADEIPDNDPHVGCSFNIEFRGYDQGDLEATWELAAHAPSGNGEIVKGGSVDIGEDPAGGAPDLDALVTVTITDADLAGLTAHAQQGYHLKLTVHAEGSKGADVKHKVFWVNGCGTSSSSSGGSSSGGSSSGGSSSGGSSSGGSSSGGSSSGQTW